MVGLPCGVLMQDSDYEAFLNGGGQLFAGLGPALVAFQVLHSSNEDNADTTVTTGVKVATELRMGARFNTGMVQAPLAPVSSDAAEALEIEIYMGRRHQFNPSGVGFNLSAWRIGGGLALRF